MKKILLASVAGAGLLASCNNLTVEVDPVRNLKVGSYSTNWQLTTDVRDQTGQIIPKGTSIICDNQNTTMSVGVTWQGGLQRLALQFKGALTNDIKAVATNPLGNTNFSGSGTYEYTFSPRTAPLSVGGKLSSQAIVVNPVPGSVVTVKGYTYVQAQGFSLTGTGSNVDQSQTAIAVANCAV